ncbi:Ger(x)C family spore germination protein [Alicyclobacillus dauci]
MRYVQLVLCCLLLLFLPGCWDYTKINERAQILGIGVDPSGSSTNRLRYTFQVPNLEQGSQSKEGQATGGGGGWRWQ